MKIKSAEEYVPDNRKEPTALIDLLRTSYNAGVKSALEAVLESREEVILTGGVQGEVRFSCSLPVLLKEKINKVLEELK